MGCEVPLGLIEQWRKQFNISDPMRYVFESGSLGQKQLEQISIDCLRHQGASAKYGMHPGEVLFAGKNDFAALQAADILAWQVQNHMRRTVMVGGDPQDRRLAHQGFRLLRENRPMAIGFYSTDQTRKVFDDALDHRKRTGRWPWDPNPFVTTVKLGRSGSII